MKFGFGLGLSRPSKPSLPEPPGPELMMKIPEEETLNRSQSVAIPGVMGQRLLAASAADTNQAKRASICTATADLIELYDHQRTESENCLHILREGKDLMYEEEVMELHRELDLVKSELTVVKSHLKDAITQKQKLANENFVLRAQVESFEPTKHIVKQLRMEKERLIQRNAKDQAEFLCQMVEMSDLRAKETEKHNEQMKEKKDKLQSLEREIKNQNRCISFQQIQLKKLQGSGGSAGSITDSTCTSHSPGSSIYADQDDDNDNQSYCSYSSNGGPNLDRKRMDSFRDVITSFRNMDNNLVADMKDAAGDIVPQKTTRPRTHGRHRPKLATCAENDNESLKDVSLLDALEDDDASAKSDPDAKRVPVQDKSKSFRVGNFTMSRHKKTSVSMRNLGSNDRANRRKKSQQQKTSIIEDIPEDEGLKESSSQSSLRPGYFARTRKKSEMYDSGLLDVPRFDSVKVTGKI